MRVFNKIKHKHCTKPKWYTTKYYRSKLIIKELRIKSSLKNNKKNEKEDNMGHKRIGVVAPSYEDLKSIIDSNYTVEVDRKILKNDEAFAKLIKGNHFSSSSLTLRSYDRLKMCLFDNLQFLDNMIMIYKSYYIKFDKDYIENILPQRLKENRWELLNAGLLSR